MPVMNTAFGPPKELPFDMGHLRHPIQYYIEPTAKPAQRRAARLRVASLPGNTLSRFTELCRKVAAEVDVDDATLDGEVIAADETGRFCKRGHSCRKTLRRSEILLTR
jgi:hypothetical protein